ncbi:hypothetical protein B0J18DRAFT_291779 [Chaetomium sp. MPI-SDFR-AT-0129]|nr:hypothetical protein B0J18DRAFT_291779 [Chaetomium sp. MPI-SDFR-AT-0129]
MKSSIFVAAALAVLAQAMPDSSRTARHNGIFGRYVKGKQKPITSPELGTSTVQGCFNSSGSLVFQKTFQWNSIGKCGDELCRPKGFPAGATMGGNQCFCGQKYPPKETLVDPSHCDAGCTGFGEDSCGGPNFWTVYNTGIDLAVDYLDMSELPHSTSSSSKPTQTEVNPEKTVVVTQNPTSTPKEDDNSGGGGPNVAGIAAGVVVAIVVVAALIGGGFIYMRRKRNLELEEEHRRNAAVNAFIGNKPRSSGGTSMADARMDPVMAHRRMSDGSIADNEDYSRRILRVTNA